VDGSVAGQDTGFTLASLLAQSIPQRAILLAVAEEWNRSRPLLGRDALNGAGGNRSPGHIEEQQISRFRALSPEQAAAAYNELVHKQPNPSSSVAVN
jgi:hypothetical protein